MSNKLTNALFFVAGAAIGSLVTWKIVKTKYERIAQEEIDSVKETWARMSQRECDEVESDDDDYTDDEDEEDWDEDTIFNYHDLASKYNRSSDSEAENSKEGGGDGDSYINGPYVIDPDDYADDNYGYNTASITYYADGVLADTWDVELDIEETIGEDAIKRFGEYADDVIHVRNERLEIDYEVVRDPRNYRDVIASAPTGNYAD